MKLVKMQGTGNDFLFLSLLEEQEKKSFEAQFSQFTRAELVKHLCDRHFGLGADGLAFLEPDETFDFAWDFYNSDGSSAEMCGNAARCVGKLFYEISGKSTMSFKTIYGPIEAVVTSNNLVTISTSSIETLKSEFQFESKDMSWNATLIDSGVPHAVVQLSSESNLQSPEVKAACAELRSSEIVGPRGANVTLFKDVDETHIESVSFERGVEDFTLACGTGVIAASYVKSQRSGNKHIHVKVPGGDLEVDFNGESPKLTGPAVKVAVMELEPEFIKEIK